MIGNFKRPIRDLVSRWAFRPLAWIAELFGYEVEEAATCDFCGASLSLGNVIRHIRIFHPEQAAALEVEWQLAGLLEEE